MHKNVKWTTRVKRKVDKEWEQKTWMKRKQRALEKKEEGEKKAKEEQSKEKWK